MEVVVRSAAESDEKEAEVVGNEESRPNLHFDASARASTIFSEI
jgi:hypothetical protein